MLQEMEIDHPPRGLYSNQRMHAHSSGGGPPEIDPSEIQIQNVLGDGSFGTVYAGKCRQKAVAVKVLLKQNFDEKTLTAFRHEVEVMSKIYHPNINLFMGACTVQGKLMIVTELMKCDLETLLLEEKVNLSLLTRIKLAKDAALGVLWLHSSNPQIIHRDLKPSNLLVDDNLNCKICDFGMSQLKPRGKNLIDGNEGAKGTPLWMAPEVMLGEEFNEKADVYGFGLILWFLLTTREPYEEFDDLEKFSHSICIQHVRPIIPPNCDPTLKNLIVRCWDPSPANRPAFNEIVTQLDLIIVDLAISDPVGRKFWIDNFLSRHTVPWDEFLNAFAKLLHLTDSNTPLTDLMTRNKESLEGTSIPIDVKCFKAVLADQSHKSTDAEDLAVHIEKFGSLLAFFNPLVPGNCKFLHDIRQLLTEPWFHGAISAHDSENNLINKPDGTFLIRFSSTSPGCYTISKVSTTDSTIKHQKIQHRPGQGFEINERVYPTLQELIRGEGKELHLHTACAGSKFLPLFIEQKISGYVN